MKSLWMESSIPVRSRLDTSTAADVCVIGAGIAGLTTAYLLQRTGRSVIVIDDGEIGCGETGRTTAHLTAAIDNRYFTIANLHGEANARLAGESHRSAIDRIEDIVRDEGIDCDFRRLDGYLFAGSEEQQEILTREERAARNAGVPGVELIERDLFAGTGRQPVLHFPAQGRFHPMRYLEGLARAIEGMGGRIYSGTHAEHIEGGSAPSVTTRGGYTIGAGAVVVATNSPINHRVVIHTKQSAYRSYVMTFEIPAGQLEDALYWDTLDPYHYLRLQPGVTGGNDLLIVGGEDHRTGQEDDGASRFAALEAWTRLRIPEAGVERNRWSGQIMETVDGLAFIGRDPMWDRNVYLATGDSGMGMTHGTIAGMLLTDLISGKASPWEALYDPSRHLLRSAGEYLRENLNSAAWYTSWVTAGDKASEDEIAPGTGALVRHGLSKLAVYRDRNGGLHAYSAVCPHLGGIVQWNSTESSWDCPCHGSRFTCMGELLDGPANQNLTPATLPTLTAEPMFEVTG